MTIGEQIKYWRKQRKMSQEELAQKIGVSGKQAIYSYERGVRTPTIETLRSIAEALDCELEINFKDLKHNN